ncbi:MAG TPA: 50S ribosomal protein L4 [Candidatus Saccharimonadales bacterium]|nr:50S ribosomal protein L4 [Candidatus Saccharimonadales bacterium]
MAVATYTKAGTKATTPAKLDKAVFGIEAKNHDLLKAAYDAYLANGRRNLAQSKTRGEVRGSTIKPWRQKGTGRARFGSRYNPIWRGGGIVFGPTGQENYSKQLNTKAKRQAIRQALSLANTESKVIVIEDVVSKDGKTAEMVKLLAKIGATRNILIVVDKKTAELEQATRNLPNVKVTAAAYVNVYDVLNADSIVFTQPALKVTTEWLSMPPKRAARPSEEAK